HSDHNCLELESSLQKTLKDAEVVNFGGDVLEPATDQQDLYRIRCNVTISFSTRKPATFMRRRNATKCDVIHWDRSMSPASLFHIPCCRFSDVEIESYTFSVISGVKLVLLLWTTPTSPTLEPVVKFLSHSKGHIESPGWTKERQLPLDVDSCVTVETPSSNVLLRLVGKEGLECGPDLFALTEGRGCTGKMLWNTCNVMLDSLDPAGDLKLRSGAVSLRFGAVGGVEKGFRILFSFYNDTSVLRRLPIGEWICFVQHWADSQRFFLCRLQVVCIGSYTEQSFCRLWECYFPLNLEDDCYSYIRPDVNETGSALESSPAKVSWDEALGYCTARNLSLPAPETGDERLFFYLLLDGWTNARRTLVIYLGLTKAREKMYHKLWKWSTGTIAYTVEVDPPIDVRKDDILGGGMTPDFRGVLYGFIRTERHPADCWLDDNDGGENCAAPMTPLPPSFTCDSQAERVPFSLVCDHQKDCGDGSDEEFCVFPPCEAGLYQCENKQCVPWKFHCDELEQCSDSSDEAFCSTGEPSTRDINDRDFVLVSFMIARGVKSDQAVTRDVPNNITVNHFEEMVRYKRASSDSYAEPNHSFSTTDRMVVSSMSGSGNNGFRTSVPIQEFTIKKQTLQASLVPPTERLESSSLSPAFESTMPGPQLEVVFSSPLKGYIQTPGWSERKQSLEKFNNCLALEAPPRHVVMATVLTIDADDVLFFRLFEGAGCIGEVIMAYTSEIQSSTELSRSSVMSVRFASYPKSRQSERFKLLFSFHNQSALPERLPDGKWNCSVPHWGDFQQHFLCTLEPECAEGQDDVICPWKDSW
ncbi:hypothetical protein BaRGS_00013541, partial [Batillaria attramentaria]